MTNKELNRKDFLKKGIFSLGTMITVPTFISACVQTPNLTNGQSGSTTGASPSETKGPFPIKTPAELVRENIIGDRKGIPLMISFKILKVDNEPLGNTLVDLWHCDASGFYSEYGGTGMQSEDFTNVHFLRGRQTTNANGEASFISIYPGWYRGRAPHLHVEILNNSGNSLLVTQVAFPEEVSNKVYATSNYNGKADTANASDNVFIDSLAQNMADSVIGNTTDGYTLIKTIKVNA